MKRNQYDESFKSEAVKLALSGELSYAEIAVKSKSCCKFTLSNPSQLTN